MSAISNRYEFVYLFDVENGNPNGDPDAGNMPRIDPETGTGLVTDVCLKRKIRNFVNMLKEDGDCYKIYVQEKAVLNHTHDKAYSQLDNDDTIFKLIPENIRLNILDICQKFRHLTTKEVDGKFYIILSPFINDIVQVKKIKKESTKNKKQKPQTYKNTIIKEIKKIDEKDNCTKISKKFLLDFLKVDVECFARLWMCKNFYDVRTFGAVMSTGEHSCGQVRGPVQITFSKSIDPILPSEISITRMAVTNEKDEDKEQTMGRKFIVPYALYRAEGYISAHLAGGDKGTGFSEDDLELLWQSLANMFDHDHSAARGKMNARGLIVFKHDSALGNAPAHKLFDSVSISRKTDSEGPARAFSDYEIEIDESGIPKEVNLDVKF